MGAYLACYHHFVGGIVLFVPLVGKVKWYAYKQSFSYCTNINLSKKRRFQSLETPFLGILYLHI
jgi:hypothetical protein